jgi:hypothetical protein
MWNVSANKKTIIVCNACLKAILMSIGIDFFPKALSAVNMTNMLFAELFYEAPSAAIVSMINP